MPSYTIPPNSYIVKLVIDNGVFPLICPNYEVENTGDVEVDARTIYGTEFGWIGIVNEEIIKPGDTKIIDNFHKVFYVLGLKIINHTDTTATVIASYENRVQTAYHDKLNQYNYLKEANVPNTKNKNVFDKNFPKTNDDNEVYAYYNVSTYIKKFGNSGCEVISNVIQPLSPKILSIGDNLRCKL